MKRSNLIYNWRLLRCARNDINTEFSFFDICQTITNSYAHIFALLTLIILKMMHTGIITKVGINIFLILLLLAMGVVLRKTGKPYHNTVLAFHKLASLGFVVLTSVLLAGYIKTNGINLFIAITLAIACLSTLVLFFSGAMLSLGKLQIPMQILHKISTFILLISTTGLFFAVFK